MTANSSASEFELLFSCIPTTLITSLTAPVSLLAWVGSGIDLLATRISTKVMNFLLGFSMDFLFLPLLNRPTSSSKLAIRRKHIILTRSPASSVERDTQGSERQSDSGESYTGYGTHPILEGRVPVRLMTANSFALPSTNEEFRPTPRQGQISPWLVTFRNSSLLPVMQCLVFRRTVLIVDHYFHSF